MSSNISAYRRRLHNKLSYYSSVVTDKFLSPERLISVFLNFNQKKLLICILHGEVNKFRTGYLYSYYKQFSSSCDFLFYSDYTDIAKHVVKVSNSKTYSSNELKHLNMLNALSRLQAYNQYEYVLFVDDDTFVNLDQLLSYIKVGHFSEKVIYGELLNVNNNPTNKIYLQHPELSYLSGGAGYLAPGKLLADKKQFKNFMTGYSDVSFSLNFKGDFLRNSALFKSQNYGHYQFSVADIWKCVTFHYVKTEKDFNYYLKASKSE